MPRINERRVVIGVTAAAAAWGGTHYGVAKMIPGIGPVGAPLVLIALGAVLVTIAREGTLGAALEGAGYGAIVVGALELGG